MMFKDIHTLHTTVDLIL